MFSHSFRLTYLVSVFQDETLKNVIKCFHNQRFSVYLIVGFGIKYICVNVKIIFKPLCFKTNLESC